MKRTIIIGDVHGCFEELENLLVATKYNQNRDRLIFVGDLVDRGPHSGKCVQMVRELGAEVVLGNHEEKHLRYRKHEQLKRQNANYRNPMRSFNDDKKRTHQQLTDADIEWIRSWPLQLSLGPVTGAEEWRVVHAGFEFGLPLDAQDKDHVIRTRWVDSNGLYKPYDHDEKGRSVLGRPEGTSYWADVWPGPCSVVYGHAVHSLEHPKITMNTKFTTVGIDTGCCFGGRLTAFLLPEFEFVQVKARRAYFPLPDKWNE